MDVGAASRNDRIARINAPGPVLSLVPDLIGEGMALLRNSIAMTLFFAHSLSNKKINRRNILVPYLHSRDWKVSSIVLRTYMKDERDFPVLRFDMRGWKTPPIDICG